MADDHGTSTAGQFIPLLDADHPFPSLPPRPHKTAFDPTPVQTVLSLTKGQVVAIGSLDRSIRLHQIQLTVSSVEENSVRNHHQTWFDFQQINQKDFPSVPFVSASTPFEQIDFKASSAAKPSPDSDRSTARRFQLPFFRNGSVYERPLMRSLILQTDTVAVYGDLENSRHIEVAAAIQSCGLANVLDFVQQMINPIADLDADGRLALVLGRLADPIPSGSDDEPIRGCVRPADFQPGRPTSVDAIYLDPEHILTADLQSLLAHEMAHAAAFSLLVKCDQLPTSMPSWLNEAVAHLIEEQIAPDSQNLQVRRRQYQKTSWLYPTMIPNEVSGMKLRRGPVRIASLELLKSAFDGHPDFDLKRLIADRGDGVLRLQSVTGDDFPALFRRFTLRLIRQASSETGMNGDSVAAAFALNGESTPLLDLRGTAVAISSPAEADCQLTIATTRDAMLQVTIVDRGESE